MEKRKVGGSKNNKEYQTQYWKDNKEKYKEKRNEYARLYRNTHKQPKNNKQPIKKKKKDYRTLEYTVDKFMSGICRSYNFDSWMKVCEEYGMTKMN